MNYNELKMEISIMDESDLKGELNDDELAKLAKMKKKLKEMEVQPEDLTQEEKATNFITYNHIREVGKLLYKSQCELGQRALDHDQTKLYPPEVDLFVEYTPKLKNMEYGSEEYKNALKGLSPALEHHYATYRHHPEHFENGVNDMNLIDLLEMVCDWKASSKRNKNADIVKSIKEINKNRFGLSDQLTDIILNTIEFLEKDK